MCARYVGDESKVVLLFESGTYASSSGAGQWIGLVQDNDITENVNTMDIRYAGQASRDVGIFQNLALDAKGKMKYLPQDWRMFSYALGSCVDAGAGPYSHTMTAINNNVGNAFTSGTLNPFMSFTIEESSTAPGTGLNAIKTLGGCVVDTLEVVGKGGGVIECNVDYIGQAVTYSSGTTTAVTAATTRPFIWSDFQLHIPSGTVYQEVKDWSIKVMNNFNAPHYNNGSQVIAVPVAEDRSYEVNITLDSTSERMKTLYTQYFKGGSTFNMLIPIAALDAGAGSKDVMLTMSGCKLVDMGDPMPSRGVSENKLKIRPGTMNAIAHDLIATYNPF